MACMPPVAPMQIRMPACCRRRCCFCRLQLQLLAQRSVPVEVRLDAGPGKGKGVFATRDIRQGELIFEERALVSGSGCRLAFTGSAPRVNRDPICDLDSRFLSSGSHPPAQDHTLSQHHHLSHLVPLGSLPARVPAGWGAAP